jgi:nucleotide-binding universal stress UspA family protein
MPKVILLPVSGSAADTEVFATALAVARLFDSHIIALHARPDVRRDIAGLASSDGGMAAGIDGMITSMEDDADTHQQAASGSWHAFCAQNGIAVSDTPVAKGITSEWVSEIGAEADWIAAYGRTADLVVVGRGEASWGPDYVLMEAALMDTGTPALIAALPADGLPAPALDSVIGIAWKDTREAAGAVRAALPFLRTARHVTIFNVPETDEGSDKSVVRLAKALRWYNPNVSVQPLLEHTRPAVTVLLDAAVQAGCGLLVMGGYGHSRLMEAVFGGFTRDVLAAAPLPVLVTH